MVGKEDKNIALQIINSVVKTSKVIGMYPDGHPALNNSSRKHYETLHQSLQRVGRTTLKISRSGVLVNEFKFSPEEEISRELIELCFWRRIGSIEIFPKVTFDEFFAFCKLLTEPRERFEIPDFMEDYVVEKGIKRIWVNGLPFDKALENYTRRSGSKLHGEKLVTLFKELEEQTLAPEVLRKAINKLRDTEEPNEYYNLLKRIIASVKRVDITLPEYAEIALQLAQLLAIHFTQQGKHPLIRKFAGEGLRTMANQQIISLMVSKMRKLALKKAIPIINTLVAIGPLVIKPLVTELRKEKNSSTLQLFAKVISLLGEEAVEEVRSLIYSGDELAIKNALYVLAQVKDSKKIKDISSLLNHQNREIRILACRVLISSGAEAGVKSALAYLKNVPDEEMIDVTDSLIEIASGLRSEEVEKELVEFFKTRKNLDLKLKILDFLGASDSRFATDTIVGVLLRKESYAKDIPGDKIASLAEKLFKEPTGQKIKILYRLMREGKKNVSQFAAHKLAALAEFYL